jgi:NSS family neurotransmitter:Na+ symporter
VVELLQERTPLNRVGATLVAAATIWALGVGALLSFNVWSDVKLAGLNIFDLLDYATSKFMLPLAGLGAVVFAAWKLEQGSVQRELQLGDTGFEVWKLLARYVAPLGVLYVFWSNLLYARQAWPAQACGRCSQRRRRLVLDLAQRHRRMGGVDPGS